MATHQPTDDVSTDDDSHPTRREVIAAGATGLATVATSGVASADESDETGEETADTWEWSGPVELGEMIVTYDLTPAQWAEAQAHFDVAREDGYEFDFDTYVFNHSTANITIRVAGQEVDAETGEVE